MAVKLVIEGDVVKSVEEQVLMTASTEEWFKQLSQGMPFDTPILPRDVFKYSQGPSYSLVCFEVPKGKMNFDYHWRQRVNRPEGVATFTMPWMQWYLVSDNDGRIARVWASWSKKSVFAESEQPFYYVLLPNFHGTSRSEPSDMCYGEIQLPKGGLKARVVDLISQLYNGKWNDDLMPSSSICPDEINNEYDRIYTEAADELAKINKGTSDHEKWENANGDSIIGKEYSAENIADLIEKGPSEKEKAGEARKEDLQKQFDGASILTAIASLEKAKGSDIVDLICHKECASNVKGVTDFVETTFKGSYCEG